MKEKRNVGRPRTSKEWATKMRHYFSVSVDKEPKIHALLYQAQLQGDLPDLVIAALSEYIINHNLPYQDDAYVLASMSENIKISIASIEKSIAGTNTSPSWNAKKKPVPAHEEKAQRRWEITEPVRTPSPHDYSHAPAYHLVPPPSVQLPTESQPVRQELQVKQPVQTFDPEDPTVQDNLEIADKLTGGFA